MSSSTFNHFETRIRNPDPKSSALLVIDVQNHFIGIAKPILPALNTTINLCRRASIPIFFTRHCHKSESDYGMLHEWWDGEIIHEGTFDSQLIADLDRTESDPEILKNTYSGFRGTNLEEKLIEIGVKDVIITGVMTNLCCETTARDAFIRGFRVFFSTDANATSCYELHEATLKNLAFGFAYLVDCNKLRLAFSDSNT